MPEHDDHLNAAVWDDPYIDILIAHPMIVTGSPACPTAARSASRTLNATYDCYRIWSGTSHFV